MKTVFAPTLALFFLIGLGSPALAAGPSAADALKLQPVHEGIVYDRPTEKEVAKCTIRPYRSGDTRGWIVEDETGKPLRRFLDTNRDNKVDQWCYYHQGVEVYRDIDSDFNLKADQHRWMGTAGSKFGVDSDEDGTIDTWKWISAEEVSEEAVYAVASQSVDRLKAILVTAQDLDQLKITGSRRAEILEKAKQTMSSLTALGNSAAPIPQSAKWIYFGAVRPGLVPGGTEEVGTDLIVYERAVAIYQADGKQHEFPLGTLIRTLSGWRLIEVPLRSAASETKVASSGGYFFQTSLTRLPSPSTSAPQGDPAVQKLIKQLEEVDRQLAQAATPQSQARYQAQRAEVLEKLYQKVATDEERNNWIRQLADTIAAAVQTGQYADGIEKLEQLLEKVSQGDRELRALIRFRLVAARYAQQLAKSDADPAKVQEEWLKELDDFVREYPKADDAPEAMLQLAVASEFSGKEKDAVRWYERIVADFGKSAQSAKAAGAIRRINSVGKRISLRGKTTSGDTYSLDADRGRVVVVIYWATWCQPCVEELDRLKQLYARYGSRGLRVVAVSLDSDSSELQAFLGKKKYPFRILHEEGGLESRLAQEMGILTLPMTLVIDRQGKVVRRSVLSGELASEVRKALE